MKTRLRVQALAALLALSFAGTASAEAPTPARQRPGDDRPKLQEFVTDEESGPRIPLPALPALPEADRKRASSGLRIFVRRVEVVGSRVFSDEELAEVAAPFENREISSEDLERLRRVVHQHYLDAGYATSGAVIPDQDLEDGVVRVQVIEGQLGRIDIEGTERFRPSYLRDRIRLGAGPPLNVNELEAQLQILQQDERIKRINAELGPGPRRGEGLLAVAIEEARPWHLWLVGTNDRSPSVGSEGGQIVFEHLNLTGNGDVLVASGSLTEGFDDVALEYEIPLNAHDTRLGAFVNRTTSEFVENPFDELEIEAESVSYGLRLSHPLYRGPGRELWIGLTAEYRESETYLLGERFSFSMATNDGHAKVSVLRLSQEWTSRTRKSVVAARSTISIGVDAFGATTNQSDVPDSRFVTWLAQFQYARRLPERWRRSQFLFRSDLQLTSDPLLSLEQFAVGGSRTVRGYRENELVRDNGWVSSIELRIPILRGLLQGDLLQIAPFIDVGSSWNDKHTEDPRTLSSIGVGLLYRPSDRLLAEIYWGGRLRDLPNRGNDLQKHGVYFRVTLALR
jgi:hemolysin activation/secretion protein